MTEMERRAALALIGGAAGLMVPIAAGAAIEAAAPAGPLRFAHGVASGDPGDDGAVIWTRLSGAIADADIRWHVAARPDAAPLRSGRVAARVVADHTVKVEVSGLKPGIDYYYWFSGPGGERSPVGRFRTLPRGRVDRLVLAVASCQLYPGGLFNAYADMAARPQLHAVIHLGDYIYEYGKHGYGAEIGKRLNRFPDPPHDIVTLDDYRRRHAQVKADPDMQAAHARAAFICVWDDHEVANDGWIGGAENHDPAKQGDWRRRKAAAMQAYFEWMPIRDSRRGMKREAIFRSFEFGDLATLAMVETRLLARSKQVEEGPAASGQPDYAAILAKAARPDREMLGADQQRWLEGVLTKSVRAGKPWQLLGNQVVMARVAGPVPGATKVGGQVAAMLAKVPATYRKQLQAMVAGFAGGLPLSLDSWDGYPAARERLYASMRRAGSRPIVLSGDSHAAWVNDLYDDGGTLVAAELGATAITSPSYGSLLPGLGTVLADINREVTFCDQDKKGYLLLTLTPDRAIADQIAVSTVLAKPFTSDVVARFVLSSSMRTPWQTANSVTMSP